MEPHAERPKPPQLSPPLALSLNFSASVRLATDCLMRAPNKLLPTPCMSPKQAVAHAMPSSSDLSLALPQPFNSDRSS